VITDGTATATANENITVNAVNDAPVAVDDAYTTDEDTSVQLLPLTGDTDADGDTLSIVSINGTALTPGTAQSIAVTNGTVAIDAAGVITFTPAANYNGAVSFPYVITDGTATATANENITVNAVNDAPVAVDDLSTTDPNVAVTIPVLTNDTDIDGDTLSVSSIVTTPTNGTVVINGDDTITYTPNPGFEFGTDTFEYEVCDGSGLCDIALVTVEVPKSFLPPTANPDTNSTAEEVTLTVAAGSGLLSNDTDPNSDETLIVTTFEVGGTTYSAGTTVNLTEGDLTINADGSYEFIPESNYNGSVPQVTYSISDGNGGTSSSTLDITVTPVNDLPMAQDDSVSVVENSINNVINVLQDNGNGADSFGGDGPNFGAITLVAGTSSNGGTITVNNNGTPNDPTDDSINYTPATDFSGTDTFNYTITDGNGDNSTATVTVLVLGCLSDPFADCDGDGDANGTDPDSNNPCVYTAGSTPDTSNPVWQAADCDGDGDANGTDPDSNNPCVYTAGSTPDTSNPVWQAADCDGDGDANGTDPDSNNPCVYTAGSTPDTSNPVWQTADCDGDGDANGTDPDSNNPCVYTAGSTPDTSNPVWQAADCDGDGVTNGDETTDGTDVNDPCDYNASSITLTQGESQMVMRPQMVLM
ncbi:Ig-like domain-containing protein, partial [Geojedonia litorea]